ncbi:MAG: class I SAM-dependent methyltransferase [Bacteroidales bacterium]|nr:class I SAM-dependent methyltransferase [Bacteroidales bacterium]
MKRFGFIITIFIILTLVYFLLVRDKSKRWTREWEESFESFQPSSHIMDLIGIGKNMYVGEIGGGNGRFAVRVARRVGDSGRVYANDIDLKAVRFMNQRCERENIENMQVILSKATYPNFPRNKLDLVYVINTYEHFSDPVRLLANTKYSLKPDGKLAIIATDPERNAGKKKKGVPRKTILQNVSEAGYKLLNLDTVSLPYDNIYIFEKTLPAN